MKKLLKQLGRFDEDTQIKLSKWTRELLYAFLKEFVEGIRDGKL